jgi:hypothetical protein
VIVSLQAYSKQSIALAQLETALRLFHVGDDLISVITLAGAAEEILGKLVKKRGQDNSLDSLKKTAAAIHERLFSEPIDTSVIADRANRARNAMKHVTAAGDPVSLDLREEAVDILNRAVDDYWILETNLTAAMDSFLRAQRAA